MTIKSEGLQQPTEANENEYNINLQQGLDYQHEQFNQIKNKYQHLKDLVELQNKIPAVEAHKQARANLVITENI